MIRHFTTIWLVLTIALSACSGSSDKPPQIENVVILMLEDTVQAGQLVASDPDYDPLYFLIRRPPEHGTLNLDPTTGTFSYVPQADYFGSDTAVVAAGSNALLTAATVSITVANVPDAPRLQAVPDQQNSAYQLTTEIEVPVIDPDGDPLTLTATSSNPQSVAANIPVGSMLLRLTPDAAGRSHITVTANDGTFSRSVEFDFTVGDVTRTAALAGTVGTAETVTLVNSSDRWARFTLSYNGYRAMTSVSEAATYVTQMPEQIPGETFGRKLWRYVRDNTYHEVPINDQLWWNDMWATMNSLGFGFCGNVAAVYVEIARAAGYEARVWGLTGHVVPEIFEQGAWRLYDPDLAVYYFNRNGEVASVEELGADPTLITDPFNRILPETMTITPYSLQVADIYQNAAGNNFIANDLFLSTTPTGSSLIQLPPAARLLLPGQWTDNPVGYDGDISYIVRAFRQAAIELSANWTGELPQLPWVLWDVQGTGTVTLSGQSFAAGDAALRSFLQAPGRAQTQLTINSSTGALRLVFMINAMRYDLLASNSLAITGKDVWAVAPTLSTLAPANAITVPFPSYLRKPVASP